MQWFTVPVPIPHVFHIVIHKVKGCPYVGYCDLNCLVYSLILAVISRTSLTDILDLKDISALNTKEIHRDMFHKENVTSR